MRGRASSRRSDDVIALLDIGTSKVACVIVAVPQRGAAVGLNEVAVRVLGTGVCPSRGVKSGTVFAFAEAEQAVREAVAQAERGAQAAVESVLLAVACGRLRSATFTAETSVEGRVVEAADIERLMAAAQSHAERNGRMLLHLNCISYRLDGTGGIGHPLGLAGSKLGADLHVVTADDAPLRNMMHVVERAYLSAAGLVPAPYASALAATTGEERHRGVLCLDIGAGTTSLAAFAHGHLLSCEVVPIGGQHATLDLAQALSAPVYEAERIKKHHVSLAGAGDDQESITYALADEETGTASRTKGEVRAMVRARMLGLFGEVASRLERSQASRYAKRVVLTGGASQQPGLVDLAADVFARPVRAAQIDPGNGALSSFANVAFSTCAGLVQVALDPSAGMHWERHGSRATGYLQRMGQWLRESF
ncbi:MAG: cell division protein FtsA [Hyphomicrobiaceae bacterium]|nr:cell division protein FtsA [Hyphomicrobiaceae bacterium]